MFTSCQIFFPDIPSEKQHDIFDNAMAVPNKQSTPAQMSDLFYDSHRHFTLYL